MASLKHLSQLLKEDQEPFILHNYINERRRQLKKPVQVQRRRSNSENSKTSCRINLCKNACFISSGNVQNSPLFDFSASPCKNSNTLFIQIPSSTATMLLEAALRIQSNQSDDTQKTKTPKNFGFSLFGSILKKLTRRGQTKSKGNKEDRIQVSVKDILRWNSMDGQKLETQEETTKESDEKRVSDVGASCSGISSLWSENIEEKSTELDTSTSRSEDSEETECVVVDQKKHGSSVNSQEKTICSSSFEFVPQNRSSPCRHSPEMEFLASSPVIQSSGSESPVASPKRYIKQVVENEEHTSTVGQKLDEEKEHNSPVSVLDPHFEENDNEQQEDDQEEEEQNDIKLESSFDFVNRTRQQLLDKLRRFELLTELDPIELEKRIAEDDDDEEEYSDDEDSISEHNEKINVFAKEVVSESNFFKRGRAPLDMKNLFKRIIITKEGEASKSSDEVFKEVDSNTIDMMIEFDFRKNGNEWAKFQDELQEMGKEIELSIFSFLVEELAVELIEDKIRTINMEFCS